MFSDPWTSGRLAALHRDDLARVAPARLAETAAVDPAARHGLVARRVGKLLIAAGRRLGGDGTPARRHSWAARA